MHVFLLKERPDCQCMYAAAAALPLSVSGTLSFITFGTVPFQFLRFLALVSGKSFVCNFSPTLASLSCKTLSRGMVWMLLVAGTRMQVESALECVHSPSDDAIDSRTKSSSSTRSSRWHCDGKFFILNAQQQQKSFS